VQATSQEASAVAVRLVLAGHPEAVADGFEAEQALGADLDAVVAGGAFVAIDHRQAVQVHVDGIEGADVGAIGEAQAAPGAFLAAAETTAAARQVFSPS
jgi:hypothetical protein